MSTPNRVRHVESVHSAPDGVQFICIDFQQGWYARWWFCQGCAVPGLSTVNLLKLSNWRVIRIMQPTVIFYWRGESDGVMQKDSVINIPAMWWEFSLWPRFLEKKRKTSGSISIIISFTIRKLKMNLQYSTIFQLLTLSSGVERLLESLSRWESICW